MLENYPACPAEEAICLATEAGDAGSVRCRHSVQDRAEKWVNRFKQSTFTLATNRSTPMTTCNRRFYAEMAQAAPILAPVLSNGRVWDVGLAQPVGAWDVWRVESLNLGMPWIGWVRRRIP